MANPREVGQVSRAGIAEIVIDYPKPTIGGVLDIHAWP